MTAPEPEAVDLGLPVLWASFNLGASSPVEFGDFFAWGEISPYYRGSAMADYPEWKAGKENGYIWESYRWYLRPDANLFFSKLPNYRGRSIFLPAAGNWKESDHILDFESCYYRSSSLYYGSATYEHAKAQGIGFHEPTDPTRVNRPDDQLLDRFLGLPIRPVKDK